MNRSMMCILITLLVGLFQVVIDEVKGGVLKESDAVICKNYHNGHKIRSMVFYPRNKLGIPKRHHAMMKDVRNSNMSDSDTMSLRYAKIEAIFPF